VLSPEEQDRLESYLCREMDRSKLGILLSLQLGLRIGEVCGLQWGDVNFQARTITIARSLQRVENSDKSVCAPKTILATLEPKTENSYRVIPLPVHLLPLLKRFYLGNPNGYAVAHRNITADNYKQNYVATSGWVACPVDISVYDDNDELIGQTVGGEVTLENADKLMLCVIGDMKYFWFPEGSNYKIKFFGTDTGTMEYFISSVDLASDLIVSVKVFENVKLYAGKQMHSEMVAITPETRLMLIKDDEVIGEIYEDGEEVLLSTPTYLVMVNGGTGGGNYAAGATVTITAGTPSTGQQFKNWSVNSGGVSLANANSASTTFVMPANVVTVTANFETITPATHTLTLNANGGTVSPPIVTQAAGTTYPLPTPTRSGFTFNGWTLSGGGSLSGNTYTFGTSNGTVMAQWTANATNYTVSNNTDGGNPAFIAPVTVSSGSSITLPAAPTKGGNIFKGWQTGNTALAAGASYTVTGDVTFTAQWAKAIFSTKYEATFLNWILFFLCFGFIWMRF
jgi:uncharacterized repeat protein (TIGR02543 family)